MLLNLSLKNFVIVDALDLSFDSGFTVLTGETGAGKSITLDAIGLLLGDKADPKQVRQGAKEAQLSALFSIENLDEVKNNLINQGFITEEENELVIRRIISAEGKSRNFINGQSATLNQLKKIGEFLIDIHGQNAHYSLMTESNQRQILDAFSGSVDKAFEVKKLFQNWQEAKQELENATQHTEQLKAERERLSWQRDELAQLAPKPNEWQELSHSYDILSHAADLMNAAQNTYDLIDNDNGVQSLLSRCMRELESLSNIESRFQESLNLLASIDAELSEVASTLRSVLSDTEINPDELARQDERMRNLSAMARKYHVDENSLPEKQKEIENRLLELEKSIDCELLQEKVNECAKKYQIVANELSNMRQIGAKRFAEEVTKVMQELSMKGAVFHVELMPVEASLHGNEHIQFQIATNQGSSLRSLAKTASGGELARISLSIQVVASRYSALPTLIFDEVDSGIGGSVAEIVGQKIHALSKNYQILAVTHLAQVAVYADNHWQVSKHNDNQHTISNIKALSPSERIDEIARMIGGTTLTDTTRQHAAEMITMAQSIKQ